jgi:subfamily B ATP-binding cassette protein HlyB/CyaB
MGSPEPAQLLDSGLCGLSLVAGYYRIAGDPAQLMHQLALTGRNSQVEDIVRGANVLQLKSRILRGVTAKRLGANSLSGDPELKGRRFRRPGCGFDQGWRDLSLPIARTAQELSVEDITALFRRIGGRCQGK